MRYNLGYRQGDNIMRLSEKIYKWIHTIYFIQNVIDLWRLFYFFILTAAVCNMSPFEDTPFENTLLEVVGFLVINFLFATLQCAFIVTYILTLFKKYKPFLVTSVVDFAVYVLTHIVGTYISLSIGSYPFVLEYLFDVLHTICFIVMIKSYINRNRTTLST